MSEVRRPTKKQYELLEFLRTFIEEHGYSPSYREIMRGCNYTSVATVALHVNSLIKRGHIIKRDKSARSLEVVSSSETGNTNSESHHLNHLIQEIEQRFSAIEKEVSQEVLDELYVLVGALKVLGQLEPARAYAVRLTQMQ